MSKRRGSAIFGVLALLEGSLQVVRASTMGDISIPMSCYASTYHTIEAMSMHAAAANAMPLALTIRLKQQVYHWTP